MGDYVAIEDRHFEELESLIRERLPKVRITHVRKAYEFARKAHEGQFRMSGTPYICHPVDVGKILAKLQVDEETLIAALLHDVPEDTAYSVEDVENEFGVEVANIVNALTKLSKVYYKHSMGERQIQSLRKMFLQTAKDPRVVIVKLADRLHNMSTLQYLRPDKQQRIAKESMEIYAPLANLYGMYALRRQMEDLCFMYLQPEEYARIEAFVQDHDKKRSGFIEDMIKVLQKELKEVGVEAELEGRPKHFYSIYQKMLRDNKKLRDIYDYFAIRIVTTDVAACYRTLGVVHESFKPKAKRFKDYIAIPKTNGYQSLHTTVVGLKGQLVEIQIRTKQMHMEAEYGAAAHIAYKKTDYSHLMDSIEKLRKYRNPEHFIRGLQDDVLQDKIYVFSPDGEIINLPEGATCIDYMYAVGLPMDKTTFRALVNHKTYSLIGELQNGDHVEIVYGQKEQEGPERWWLEHVKTTQARESIQEYFKSKSYAEKIDIGKNLLQRELDHENQPLISELEANVIDRALDQFGVNSLPKLLASIGSGRFRADAVYQVMFPDVEIGFFTRLRQRILERIQDEPAFDKKYRIQILIEAYDRVGLLADLIKPLYELNIPILSIYGRGYDIKRKSLFRDRSGEEVDMNKKYIGRDWIDVHVESHEQLVTLFDKLERIPGVIRVQRVFRQKHWHFYVLSFLTIVWFLGHPLALKYFINTDAVTGVVFRDSMLYLGFGAIFGLLFWLRKSARRTFPHFKETRIFWPLTFGLAVLAFVVVLLEDYYFDLHLQGTILTALGLLLFTYLGFSYHHDVKRSRLHLSQLKSAQTQRRRGNK